MSTLTAAVVLAWIALILLSFALAGVLRQLRDVQAELARLSASRSTGTTHAPEEVWPTGPAQLTVVLLADANCAVCEELAPIFRDLADQSSDEFDFVLLCTTPSDTWLTGTHRRLRIIREPAVFHRLDPGWRPAVVLVDRSGAVLAAEPVGSGQSLRATLDLFAGTPQPAAQPPHAHHDR